MQLDKTPAAIKLDERNHHPAKPSPLKRLNSPKTAKL
jgi:hypothetical protein